MDANQIDVQGLVVFSARNSYFDPAQDTYLNSPAPGFRAAKLVSQGDIRFLPTAVQNGTMLASSWDWTWKRRRSIRPPMRSPA